MRRIIILFSIMMQLGISKSSQAQWTEVFSDSTHTIGDIFCLNKDTCWVSGTNGLLLKTINGGSNWLPILIDTSFGYYGLSFLNDTIGFMIRGPKTLLKTIDGGNTWNSYNATVLCSNSVFFRECHAVNIDTAIYIGGCFNQDIGLYSSYDGGMSLNQIIIPSRCGFSGNDIYKMYYYSDSIGYAVGREESVYKTINKGINWTQIHEDCIGDTSIDIFGMSCYNDSMCWIGGYRPHHIYGLKYSTDGGINWQTYVNTQFGNIKDLAFFSDGSGYIINGGLDIFKTLDYGLTFNFQYRLPYTSTLPQIEFYKFFFLNSQVGYAISTHSVLKTTNGGGPVGIGEKHATAMIKIFPNPSTGEFTINKFPLYPGVWHVQVYDNMGKLVFQKQNISDKEININLSEQADGLYFVKAIFGNKSSAGKLVIMK
jgi:photosystem II stability/assembly factor-like uncharacterized protein